MHACSGLSQHIVAIQKGTLLSNLYSQALPMLTQHLGIKFVEDCIVTVDPPCKEGLICAQWTRVEVF